MWLFDEGGDVAFVIGNKFFSIVFVWFECILVVMAICLHGSIIVRILNVIVVVVVLAVEVVVAVVMVVEANNCISTNATDFFFNSVVAALSTLPPLPLPLKIS